jgi:hypothetical protein
MPTPWGAQGSGALREGVELLCLGLAGMSRRSEDASIAPCSAFHAISLCLQNAEATRILGSLLRELGVA